MDTGALVSLVSRSFYNSHLTNIPIEPLEDILDIECADGEALPYDDFIEVKIRATGSGTNESVPCLLLVVPDTQYTRNVSVLLETNVLTHFLKDCKERHGARYLQHATLTTPWYLAFRNITLSEKN